MLETPKDPEPQADLRNLATLRRLRRVSAEVVTPTRGQRALTGQVEHFGEIGAQTFWPKDTSRSL